MLYYQYQDKIFSEDSRITIFVAIKTDYKTVRKVVTNGEEVPTMVIQRIAYTDYCITKEKSTYETEISYKVETKLLLGNTAPLFKEILNKKFNPIKISKEVFDEQLNMATDIENCIRLTTSFDEPIIKG